LRRWDAVGAESCTLLPFPGLELRMKVFCGEICGENVRQILWTIFSVLYSLLSEAIRGPACVTPEPRRLADTFPRLEPPSRKYDHFGAMQEKILKSEEQ
jgi:hypothetical protein